MPSHVPFISKSNSENYIEIRWFLANTVLWAFRTIQPSRSKVVLMHRISAANIISSETFLCVVNCVCWGACVERAMCAAVCVASHGAERTGLFCAMMNMMDQLIADKEVDVYDAVKRVRQARPEFVDSIVCRRQAHSFISLFTHCSTVFISLHSINWVLCCRHASNISALFQLCAFLSVFTLWRFSSSFCELTNWCYSVIKVSQKW